MTDSTRAESALPEKWFSTYVKDNIPSLEGKNVAVTGTTSGIGFFVVVSAIRKNANKVFLLNRASSRVDRSLKNLQEEINRCGSKTKIQQVDCDLSSFSSVKQAAQELKKEADDLEGIHVLINNAGIAGTPLPLTKDGYHSMMHINYFSHFLLVEMVKDLLLKAAESSGTPSRIVNVSSGMRAGTSLDASCYTSCEKKDESKDLYGQSKLAMAIFSYEFNRRNDASKIFATVADPGMTATDIFENKGEGEKKRNFMEKFFIFAVNNFGIAHSAEDGSMALACAAFGDDVLPGDFICPSKLSGTFGPPMKAITKGKSTWTFYRESNVLDEAAGKKMWELSEEIINTI